MSNGAPPLLLNFLSLFCFNYPAVWWDKKERWSKVA